MSSDTPRMDAACGTPSHDWEATAFRLFLEGQKLERELAAAMGERDRCKNSVAEASLAFPNVGDYIAQLETERDQLRAELARAKEDVARLDAIIAISSTWTSRVAIDDRLRKIKEGAL